MGDRFDFSRRQQCKLYNSLKLYFFKRKRIFSILFLYTLFYEEEDSSFLFFTD